MYEYICLYKGDGNFDKLQNFDSWESAGYLRISFCANNIIFLHKQQSLNTNLCIRLKLVGYPQKQQLACRNLRCSLSITTLSGFCGSKQNCLQVIALTFGRCFFKTPLCTARWKHHKLVGFGACGSTCHLAWTRSCIACRKPELLFLKLRLDVVAATGC